ncbi:conserved hypothetical protein [Histoplasma capsulatum var. duboisii H88]|uniref:DUF7719 domain-containing protein n=1 Tax=Ajellomyces capsulatus (strain H88) TaxID=544711 RepID=F0UHC8_AJEC8|nr:conserved hypothetical protein [Histoplasma capsulatum var. duboisii H88]QSS55250.1 hypothetical protein I7I53_03081 [Histoplasma capsulatum var. duboisii H88]
MPPRNRKERRAAQTAFAAGNDDFDPASIPLGRPPANNPPEKPKTKTLYELAAEREAELARSRPKSSLEPQPDTEFVTISPEGKIIRANPSKSSTNSVPSNPSTDEADVDEPIPPLPDTILLSLPLSVLHLTLSFLAAHQYAQDIPLRKLIQNTAFISFPVLTFVIHLAHGHIISFDRFGFRSKGYRQRDGENKNTKKRQESTGGSNTLFGRVLSYLFSPSVKSLVFFPMALFFGGRLIAMTNEASYYAVMKKTPSVGTLWVWAVLELPLVPAIFGVLTPICWAVLYKGYGII